MYAQDVPMQIGQDTVVVFDYVMSDEGGAIIDQGNGPSAMAYIHGQGQMMPGVEKALEGKSVGDRVQAVVPPEEAYGPDEEQDEVRVPRADLPDDLELEPGAELEGTDEDGAKDTFWVVAIEGDEVVMTRNHPLAGMTLRFDMTVTKVRAATADELEHGHAHEGQHSHD
jgi:FKBP-type peptidyl-prolyl cis-trans isomerase SlyD